MGVVELAFQLGRPDHVAEDDRDDPELLGPGADRLPHWGRSWPVVQAVVAVGACRHARSIWTIRQRNRPVGDSSSKRLDRRSGTPTAPGG